MSEVNHRERAMATLAHEEPDRVPLDLGQGPSTAIHSKAYSRLVEYLGLDAGGETGEVVDHRGIAVPGESVLQRFDIDFRGVHVKRLVTKLL